MVWDWCPYKKRRDLDTDTQGKGHGTMEAQIRVTLLQDCQQPPEIGRAWFPLRRNQSCRHPNPELLPSSTGRSKFLLPKPHSLWHYVNEKFCLSLQTRSSQGDSG